MQRAMARSTVVFSRHRESDPLGRGNDLRDGRAETKSGQEIVGCLDLTKSPWDFDSDV
jgi:hypothetical protein